MTSLLSLIPRPLAELLLASPDRPPLELKHTFDGAVLFADIAGFTALSDALASGGPRGIEELTSLLNRIFTAMIAQIEAFGGAVWGFGGNALTAVFPLLGGGVRDAARGRHAEACRLFAGTERHLEALRIAFEPEYLTVRDRWRAALADAAPTVKAARWETAGLRSASMACWPWPTPRRRRSAERPPGANRSARLGCRIDGAATSAAGPWGSAQSMARDRARLARSVRWLAGAALVAGGPGRHTGGIDQLH